MSVLNVLTVCVCVCACLHRCVYLSVTLRPYITAANRKARGSLQRAQNEPSTAADGMSLSYLALYSFTSTPPLPLPLSLLLWWTPVPPPGPPLGKISHETLDVLQNV